MVVDVYVLTFEKLGETSSNGTCVWSNNRDNHTHYYLRVNIINLPSNVSIEIS